MKILFVQYSLGYYVAPMLLSALLKQHGHAVDITIGPDVNDILSSVQKINPDIVAFSVTTGNHVWFAKIAKKIKGISKALIIAGGPHPTFFPEFIDEPGIDIIARGESEFAFLELVENIRKGKKITAIKNLWVKEGGKVYKNDVRRLLPDLDKLPDPDRSLYPEEKISTASFIAGRGCPYNCSFCFNHSLKELYQNKGKYVRMKSPKAFVSEIESVKDRCGLRSIVFTDDIFITDKKWLKEFCALYVKKINLPFKCFVRANQVDEPLVMLLKSSKCHVVYFGIESGDEALRNDVLHKQVMDQQIVAAARLFHKHGIKIGTFNMMGIPSETTAQALKTVQLNRLIKTDFPRIMLLQPYPKTEICKFAVANGYMDELKVDDFGVSFIRESLIKQKNIGQLINLQRLSYFAIKSRVAECVITQLIKLPPNKIFELFFLFSLLLVNSKENKHNLFITA